MKGCSRFFLSFLLFIPAFCVQAQESQRAMHVILACDTLARPAGHIGVTDCENMHRLTLKIIQASDMATPNFFVLSRRELTLNKLEHALDAIESDLQNTVNTDLILFYFSGRSSWEAGDEEWPTLLITQEEGEEAKLAYADVLARLSSLVDSTRGMLLALADTYDQFVAQGSSRPRLWQGADEIYKNLFTTSTGIYTGISVSLNEVGGSNWQGGYLTQAFMLALDDVFNQPPDRDQDLWQFIQDETEVNTHALNVAQHAHF